MKEKNKIERFTDEEWEELSSILSDEKNDSGDLLGRFMADDSHNTIKYWKELREMNNDKEINVDKAWDKLYSRLNENGLITKTLPVQRGITARAWIRIAAVALILISLGSGLIYFGDKGILSRRIVVATSENQKNLQVKLPDGSNISLNRNSRLTYRQNFGRHSRNVALSGEAFFDITPDAANPFIVDAGTARIRVVGTSFNVITSNPESAVEVYVETGRVMVSNNAGTHKIELDPGFIGTVGNLSAEKKVNNNPNYMSWNTGDLIYDGQTLGVVFRDLKRVYNMEIIADDPQILENPWTSPIINQPEEKIIRLICTSFGLSYTKEGNVYHLSIKKLTD
jgi:ferric-dicitrate binding protein FerR (iron transport regulator)